MIKIIETSMGVVNGNDTAHIKLAIEVIEKKINAKKELYTILVSTGNFSLAQTQTRDIKHLLKELQMLQEELYDVREIV